MSRPLEDPLRNMNRSEISAITERLIRLRENLLCLNKSNLARRIGTNRSYVTLIENGTQDPSFNYLQKVASAFHVNLDWLLYGGDERSIFTSTAFSNQDDSLLFALRSAFSLSDEDCDFVQWFASLPKQKRASFINAVKSIQEVSDS